ncbi:MAG TPA: phasin family protein [Stellaceae bacterium]|nr:phasin family protein [Stellaceae bacterium]
MAKTKKPTSAVATPKTSAVATTKQANGEATAALFAGYDQLADLGRENFAAVLRANAVLSEGLEAIGKEVILYARRSFEQAAETATALLGAKTLEDVFQLNSEFAKANLERLIERSAKLSEMSVKVANEALAPLGGRVEATIHSLSRPHAG